MQRLADAGYRTHGIGKCHFSPNSHALRGFQTRESQEENPATRESDDYARQLLNKGYDWIMEPHGIRGEMYYIPQPSLLPEKEHPSHWIGDRSIAFIQEQTDSEQPWYLYSSFVHPHPPFTPPVPWHKLYRGPDMPLPDIPKDLDETLCFINRFQNRYKYRDNGGPDINLIRQIRAYYYACISFIDKQIGRILQSLEESGQLNNTLILFSADHGEYLGDYNCFGKRGMHDPSARIPMIARWPDGSFAGKKPETPVSLVDLAPTFLEAADIPIEENEYDGISLEEIASGESSRPQVFSQYNRAEDGLYMAVECHWKYIYSAPDQKEYLFDLKNDPSEHCNLAEDAEKQIDLERLRKTCLDWLASSDSCEALDSSNYWKVYPKRIMPKDPDEGLLFQDPRWWDTSLPTW